MDLLSTYQLRPNNDPCPPGWFRINFNTAMRLNKINFAATSKSYGKDHICIDWCEHYYGNRSLALKVIPSLSLIPSCTLQISPH